MNIARVRQKWLPNVRFKLQMIQQTIVVPFLRIFFLNLNGRRVVKLAIEIFNIEIFHM
jgi:hypothetical protein